MMMQEIKEVSYSEWLALVNEVKENGPNCAEFLLLQQCYPHRSGDSYEQMVQKELAKMETVYIQNAVRDFQRSIARSLDEGDLEIARSAIRSLRKNARGSVFFLNNEKYPDTICKNMISEIKRNCQLFQKDFKCFLRRLEQENNSCFIQDFIYLCRKCDMLKFVLECEKDAKLHTSEKRVGELYLCTMSACDRSYK